MPDNTNVNNNTAVTVVGRTAPVPPGQQKSAKSIPVVIASDQSTIPVAEQNKVQSEVALSLLGIPRSEVALGIFADVNTYDVNPTEWSASPEQYGTVGNSGPYQGVGATMGHGLTHIPEESGALLEAPADKSALLTSKRFFRYQPGRVSAATFGVKTTTIADAGTGIANPAVRKYGIFDKYDGYYWETRNNGKGDNFCVVRRTQSTTQFNPLAFPTVQTEDFGVTNPPDPLGPRASHHGFGTVIPTDPVSIPAGYKTREFGDLVILRDNLLMTHAGCYDPSILQPETKEDISIVTTTAGNSILTLPNVAKQISHTSYNIDTGLMTITTNGPHNFHKGKFLTLTDITMSCTVTGSVVNKVYPNRADQAFNGYNVVGVNSTTQFVINVGVSTVPTIYVSGGWAVGLSTAQHVRYSKGLNADPISGLTDTKIYKLHNVTVNTSTGVTTARLINISSSGEQAVTGLTAGTDYNNHSLVTPVPFVQPLTSSLTTIVGRGTTISSQYTKYTSIETNDANTDSAGTGMFPYVYESATGSKEGYIDTRAATVAQLGTLKQEIINVNSVYHNWVNQNVDMDYWNVYEYRIPRSRFSGDRLDFLTDTLLYSDSVATNKPGAKVLDSATNEVLTDTSIWDLDFDKVTMYKIEFSWYGAVGALFLAYVPVSSGEARWVRVHHLRASNQLKIASLGNATLPITYMIYGGGGADALGYANNLRGVSMYKSGSEHIVKYGASYYIDGGDRGTVKLFSHANDTSTEVFGNKRTFIIDNDHSTGAATTHIGLSTATDANEPYIYAGPNSGLSTSYYVGAKVITGQPLDQNIEITHVGISSNRLYLNAPISSSLSDGQTITIVSQRSSSLVGLKCRDFIASSTGQLVRNRTQVYPTRLSTGSTNGVVKLDLIKSPVFQTDAAVTNINGPMLRSKIGIGKRGKPTRVDVPLTTYGGAHTYVGGNVNDIVTTDNGSTTFDVLATGTAYDSNTGLLTIGIDGGTGSFTVDSTTVRLKKNTFAFTCSLDNYASTHTYPREIDPMRDPNDGAINNGTLSIDISGSSYNPTTGIMHIKTTQNHGLSAGSSKIQFAPHSLTLSCNFNNATGQDAEKTYPREYGSGNPGGGSDPAYQSWLTILGSNFDADEFDIQVLPAQPSTNQNAHTFVAAADNCIRKEGNDISGDWSKNLIVRAKTSTTISVRVTNSDDVDTASSAEYVRDIGRGTYGWFRGYYANDPAQKKISVFGFLENKGYDRTKNITDNGYTFYALESTPDEIILMAKEPFLREENVSPVGTPVAGVGTDFTMDGLSSIKVDQQTRSPVAKTGTVIATIFVPASGAEFDLAPYFDYNKEYLSFPLTDSIESLYLLASSQTNYNAGDAATEVSASLTWEEQ